MAIFSHGKGDLKTKEGQWLHPTGITLRYIPTGKLGVNFLIMSKQPNIEPHKITTPISLVAAWLVALCFVNGSLLATAIAMPETSWMRAALILAAIVYIPVAFWFVYKMQTTHRDKLLADDGFLKTTDIDSQSRDHFRWAIEQILNEELKKGALPISVGKTFKALGNSWPKEYALKELIQMVEEDYIVCRDNKINLGSFIDYPEWVKNG